ncbi:MAG: glycoside hydrolase family 104 protein [Pseudomonadota bacterium]|nr:glycoside hydrolase family 104 protein [Pseudomonadota bacterium]
MLIMNTNRTAFLDMISHSEGTDYGAHNGYDILCGSTRQHPKYFTGWTDHPRILVEFTDKTGKVNKSSAAGRYQILERFFDVYRKQLHLDDKTKYPFGPFSPAAQDAIALQLINECHAIPLIDAGNLHGAIIACSSRWASLPGAGYDQHEQTFAFLEASFKQAGGEIFA